MNSVTILGVLGVLTVVSVSACSSPEMEPAASDPGSGENDIIIDKERENPATVLGSKFETTLAKVIVPADKGKEFGLDDNHVPHPDTYWPFLAHDIDNPEKVIAQNGIDDRWQGKDQPSPLEKYMALLDPSQADQARDWEKKNHGELVPGVADWFGHCPGWTAAAMVEPPLHNGVTVKRNGAGELVTCASKTEKGCFTFEIGDLNALEAEVFLSNMGGFIGARCDTKPEDIKRDQHGRIIQEGCRGLNPGSLMIVLANRMKNVNNVPNFVPKAIAIDAQNPFNTDQIWNQPAYRYEVNDARPITEQDAIKVTTKGPNRPTKYPHNPSAKGFTQIDIGIHWVQENGPNVKFVSGLLSTQIMRFQAVLELDGDPSSPTTKIIGGEFLDDESKDVNRLTVPPFVWNSDGFAPDEIATGHNPFVKGSQVQKLVDLAAKGGAATAAQ